MNKIFSFAAAIGALALITAGCVSSTGGSGTAAVADVAADNTAAKADTGGDGATVATGDTGASAGGDAAATAEVTTDIAKPDVQPKDVPPVVQKCDYKESACLQTCGNAACTKEAGECAKDAKCTKLGGCLQACQKADIPKDVKAVSCGKTCLTDAGESVAAKYYAGQACLGEKCIACKAMDQDCQAACASQLCIEQLTACQADTACTLILNCLEVQKCTDQACAQGCLGKWPDGQAVFVSTAQCFQGNINACD